MNLTGIVLEDVNVSYSNCNPNISFGISGVYRFVTRRLVSGFLDTTLGGSRN